MIGQSLIGRRVISRSTRELGSIDRVLDRQGTALIILDNGETLKTNLLHFRPVNTGFTAEDVAWLKKMAIADPTDSDFSE
jgi:hypothetical protein